MQFISLCSTVTESCRVSMVKYILYFHLIISHYIIHAPNYLDITYPKSRKYCINRNWVNKYSLLIPVKGNDQKNSPSERGFAVVLVFFC